MKNSKWINLILWIVAFEIIGFLLGSLTQNNIHSWYNELNKSTLTPPDRIFGIVWSILYVLLAIVGWALWQQRKDKNLQLAWYFYLGQLLMNWAWTPLFFHLHWIGFSLIWIVILTVLTFLTIYFLYPKKKVLGLLLVPYLIWLLFASYLNYAIWALN